MMETLIKGLIGEALNVERKEFYRKKLWGKRLLMVGEKKKIGFSKETVI